MRRLLIVLAVLAVLAAGLLAALVIHRLQQAKDVRGSSTSEFTLTTTPHEAAAAAAKVPWPMYGFDATRDALGRSRAAAAVPHGLALRRRQPRRVPAVDRLRAPLLLDERRPLRRDQHEDRQARVEGRPAPLRRRVARDRPARARHGLRRVPQQAAVQRRERRPRERRDGRRVLRRPREDPLAARRSARRRARRS